MPRCNAKAPGECVAVSAKIRWKGCLLEIECHTYVMPVKAYVPQILFSLNCVTSITIWTNHLLSIIKIGFCKDRGKSIKTKNFLKAEHKLRSYSVLSINHNSKSNSMHHSIVLMYTVKWVYHFLILNFQIAYCWNSSMLNLKFLEYFATYKGTIIYCV